MKFVIAFVAFLAVASAQNDGVVRVLSDDNLGYNIVYDFQKSSRNEHHANDGAVTGHYSYIDDIGLEHHVNFQAGPSAKSAEPTILLKTYETPKGPLEVAYLLRQAKELRQARSRTFPY